MKDNKSRSTCLLGGDPECCEDCIYGADYHYVDGECVERDQATQVKKLAQELCDKSGCHHKCHDTTDCIVEDEALLLINQNKSNNFEVKSNNERQKEGEWIDLRKGKYANPLYACSLCEKGTLLAPHINNLGNLDMKQALSPYCPNCGAKMKGGEE